MKSNDQNQTQGLLYYIHLLLKWRRFITINFVLVVLVTYGITLLLPKWYYSDTIVLPPKGDGLGPFTAGLGDIARMVRAFPGGGMMASPEMYNYFSILKSRTVMDDVIRTFDLMNVYRIDNESWKDARDALVDNTVLKIDDEGALVVGVYDRDPQRAADMANYYVELLHKHSINLNVREARARREFIEKRLATNKQDLIALEEKMHAFQSEHGLMILPEQTEQSIRGIAELYAIKVVKEIELDVYSEVMSIDNPIYRNVQRELSAIERKLEGIPDQTIESFRILRELLVQQKIFELLTPLLEEARLEELRDTPTVLVVDSAIPAEEKSKPKRLLITIAMGIAALALSVVYVVTTDSIEKTRTRNPEQYQRIVEIKEMVNNPFKKRH